MIKAFKHWKSKPSSKNFFKKQKQTLLVLNGQLDDAVQLFFDKPPNSSGRRLGVAWSPRRASWLPVCQASSAGGPTHPPAGWPRGAIRLDPPPPRRTPAFWSGGCPSADLESPEITFADHLTRPRVPFRWVIFFPPRGVLSGPEPTPGRLHVKNGTKKESDNIPVIIWSEKKRATPQKHSISHRKHVVGNKTKFYKKSRLNDQKAEEGENCERV